MEVGGRRSPGADHACVMVPALAEQAPVVSNQLQIQVVGGNLTLPVLNLLQGSLVHEEWCCPCTHHTHRQLGSSMDPCLLLLFFLYVFCLYVLNVLGTQQRPW